jgi:hypothetical protein
MKIPLRKNWMNLKMLEKMKKNGIETRMKNQ